MKKKMRPFSTLQAEAAHQHKTNCDTIGFSMLGLCLLVLGKSGVRIFTEDETALIYRTVAGRYADVNKCNEEEAAKVKAAVKP